MSAIQSSNADEHSFRLLNTYSELKVVCVLGPQRNPISPSPQPHQLQRLFPSYREAGRRLPVKPGVTDHAMSHQSAKAGRKTAEPTSDPTLPPRFLSLMHPSSGLGQKPGEDPACHSPGQLEEGSGPRLSRVCPAKCVFQGCCNILGQSHDFQ